MVYPIKYANFILLLIISVPEYFLRRNQKIQFEQYFVELKTEN